MVVERERMVEHNYTSVGQRWVRICLQFFFAQPAQYTFTFIDSLFVFAIPVSSIILLMILISFRTDVNVCGEFRRIFNILKIQTRPRHSLENEIHKYDNNYMLKT